jgi:hypothetical protein
VHLRAVPSGTAFANADGVLNFFLAGPDLVRWELTRIDDGACRLTVHHAHGTIVEYFTSPTAALLREKELEDLLTAARRASAGMDWGR